MKDKGCWKLEAGSWKLDAGCWKLEAGCWMLEAGVRVGDVGDLAVFANLDWSSDARVRESDEVRPGVIADFGYDGEIVRFVVLSASKVVSQPSALAYELVESSP